MRTSKAKHCAKIMESKWRVEWTPWCGYPQKYFIQASASFLSPDWHLWTKSGCLSVGYSCVLWAVCVATVSGTRTFNLCINWLFGVRSLWSAFLCPDTGDMTWSCLKLFHWFQMGVPTISEDCMEVRVGENVRNGRRWGAYWDWHVK